MTITIDKQEIYTDVRREVEYAGAKQGDYARVRLISEDEELLRRWITESCVTLERELRAIAMPAIATEDTWMIVVRHENGRETWLNTTANSFVESQVTGRWLRKVFPTLAEEYEVRAAEELAKVVSMAYYREMPVREEYESVSSDGWNVELNISSSDN